MSDIQQAEQADFTPKIPKQTNISLFLNTFPAYLTSTIILMAVGMINAIMAARISTLAMSSLALAGSIIWPIHSLGGGVMSIVMSKMGYVLGKDQPEKVGIITRQVYFITAIISAVIILILLAFAASLEWFEIAPEMIEIVRPYLYLNCLLVPLVQFLGHLRNINSAIAFTFPTMLSSIIGIVMIFPLNWLFMYGHLPGAEGPTPVLSAFSHLIIYSFYIIFLISFMVKDKKRYAKLKLFTPLLSKPDFKFLKDTFKVGLPISIQFWLEASFYGLVAVFLAKLGTSVVAAHETGMILYGMVYSVGFAASSTLNSVVSRRLGEHNRALAVSMLKNTLAFVVLCNLGIAVVLYFARPFITETLIPDDLVARDLAMKVLLFLGMSNIFDAVFTTLLAYLTPYRDTKFTMLVTILLYWGVFLPIAYFFAFNSIGEFGNFGIYSFWTGFIVVAIICSVIYTCRAYFKWYKMPDPELYAILDKNDETEQDVDIKEEAIS